MAYVAPHWPLHAREADVARYRQKYRELVDSLRSAFADIDVQLKQRHDLIPNLVETVKGYASHEAQTLEAVTAARNAAV